MRLNFLRTNRRIREGCNSPCLFNGWGNERRKNEDREDGREIFKGGGGVKITFPLLCR